MHYLNFYEAFLINDRVYLIFLPASTNAANDGESQYALPQTIGGAFGGFAFGILTTVVGIVFVRKVRRNISGIRFKKIIYKSIYKYSYK